MITAAGLCKGYGGPPVFEDVAFDLGRGERLLVLGLNGAGKTSLLRMLVGQEQPDSGTVTLGETVAHTFTFEASDAPRQATLVLLAATCRKPIEVVEIDRSMLYVLHDACAIDLDPAAAGFQAVISGHTHRPSLRWCDGVLFLNPGSAGPRPAPAAM